MGDAEKIIWDVVPVADNTGTGWKAVMQVDVNSYGVCAALHMDTDGNWINADASVVGTMPCMALALATGTGSTDVLLKGIMRNDDWNFTIGAQIYVSTTAGDLTDTMPSATDEVIQVVGYALTADVIYFCPSSDYVTHI